MRKLIMTFMTCVLAASFGCAHLERGGDDADHDASVPDGGVPPDDGGGGPDGGGPMCHDVQDCACGESCQDGTCVRTGCCEDADCPTDETCEHGHCVPPPECARDADCGCGESCVEGTCVQTGCCVDADCPEGKACVDGRCVCDGDPDDGSDGKCRPGKTLLCHYPPGNPENEHPICVGNPAVPAHQAHGDTLGNCP